MQDFLPLFPLQLVVFPGERLNLHIFEPRYKQLIRECETNGITFGIPAFINDKVMDYGTEIELLSVEKRYENGEMDVKTRGIGKFKILEFFRKSPGKLYSGADILRIKDESKGKIGMNDQIIQEVKKLFQLLNIQKEIEEDPILFNTFNVAHQVGFSIEQEYQFLCLSIEEERQQFMLKHLQKLLPVVEEMEEIRQKAQMNGHFRNIVPPKI
jgi:ATP-dependent Lon protease